MSIMELLICAGTAVLVVVAFLASVGAGVGVAAGGVWLSERVSLVGGPRTGKVLGWVVIAGFAGFFLLCIFIGGCSLAHSFGWIADCPWCGEAP